MVDELDVTSQDEVGRCLNGRSLWICCSRSGEIGGAAESNWLFDAENSSPDTVVPSERRYGLFSY